MRKLSTVFLFCLALSLFSDQTWDFRDGDLHGFRPYNFIEYDLVPGEGFVSVGQNNAYFFAPSDLLLKASDYKYLEIGIDCDAALFPVYFGHPGIGPSEQTRLDVQIDKEKGIGLVNLQGHPNWKGDISLMRFDVVLRGGEKATVRYIRLLGEEPVYPDFGLVGNGDFSAGSRGWSGDASFGANGAAIPSGGALESDFISIPSGGKYILKVESTYNVETTVECLDILDRPIAKEIVTDGIATMVLPSMAAEVRLVLRNTLDHGVDVMQIGFYGVPDDMPFSEALESIEMGEKIIGNAGENGPFLGGWIWEPTLGDTPNGTAIFRKEFDIESLDDIAEARFNVTGDDVVRTDLNGHILQGEYSNQWAIPEVFHVKEFLKEGRNVLVSRVLNGGGPGGLMADLEIIHKDGSRTLVVTDDTWQCATVSPDDDGWADVEPVCPATFLCVNGGGAWGPVIHSGVSSASFEIKGLDLPESLDPSTVWTPKATLVLPEAAGDLGGELEFSVRLQNDRYNFMIQGCKVSGTALSGKREYALDLSPTNFRFLPAGEYNVVVSMNPAKVSSCDIPGKVTMTRPDGEALGLSESRLDDLDIIPQLVMNGDERSTLTQYLVEVDQQRDKHFRELKTAIDNGVKGVWFHHRINFDKDGNPDFTELDNFCTSILMRNPEAHIITIPGLDPSRSPKMMPFFDKNPDALAIASDGHTDIVNYSGARQKSPSMASRKWLDEGDRILTLLVEHIKEMPYGSRIAAVLPSSGITWEWMYWGSQTKFEFLDYNPDFARAFADFAREKYGTIDEANAAWGRNFASFEEIAEKNLLPTAEERNDGQDGRSIRLPSESQYVMDFNRCMAVVVTDAIIRFCDTVKRVSEGKLLAGAYYGYYKQISVSFWAQASGHWALSRLLASDSVDIFHAPSSYSGRGPGECGGLMVPEGSVRLNGKVFVTESDIRTLHTTQAIGRCRDLKETKAVLIREYAMSLARNVGFRYYDFSLGWVFRDLRLAELARALTDAEKTIIEARTKIVDPANSIAVVISENSMEHLTYNSATNTHAIVFQQTELAKSGIAWNDYITPGLQDIPTDHRMWLFENAFKLSPEDVAYIKEKILVPGNTVVFNIGVDVVAGDHFSTETLEALTGMSFDIDWESRSTRPARLTQLGVELLDAQNDNLFPTAERIVPAFRPVAEDGVRILAETEEGAPVFAESHVNGCRILFSSQPQERASWLRRIAKDAGLHCYNETNGDITWASGNFMGFHFTSGGTRLLKAPVDEGTALDLLSRKEYEIHGGVFEYYAPKMTSALFIVK